MNTIKQKREFLESKGLTVGKVEGDDFSTVFHLSSEDRIKVDQNKLVWEKENDCLIEVSDMFGMSVVMIENKEE